MSSISKGILLGCRIFDSFFLSSAYKIGKIFITSIIPDNILFKYINLFSMIHVLCQDLQLGYVNIHKVLILSYVGLLFSFFTTRFFLNKLLIALHKLGFYQPISKYLPAHSTKKNIPSLGGVAIVLSILVSILLFTRLNNHYVQIFIVTLLLFFLIGMRDDLKKIIKKTNAGEKALYKLLLLFVACGVVLALHYAFLFDRNSMYYVLPILDIKIWVLPLIYYFFSGFILCGSANAVNLTDGLDGLASSISTVVIGALHILSIFITYTTQNAQLQDLIIISSIMLGSYLGFLWHNSNPAVVFMGDSGSLSMGASLAVFSIMIKQEFFFALVGLCFVIETASVILQIFTYRCFNGKRIFKMAPLHHHFEKQGLKETKITARFTIVSLLLAFVVTTITINNLFTVQL